MSCNPAKAIDRAAFEGVIAFARRLAKENPTALVELVRLLGRRVAADLLLRPLFSEADEDVLTVEPSLALPTELPLTRKGEKFDDLILKQEGGPWLHLNRDPVLAWPWSRERLLGTLGNIGAGRSWGAWKEDPDNHLSWVWLPVGLAWVESGNHSIAAGIALGEGEVRAVETHDLTPVYRHLRCDGEYFIRAHDGKRLCRVGSLELAAIYEIGRLMLKYRVSAWASS